MDDTRIPANGGSPPPETVSSAPDLSNRPEMASSISSGPVSADPSPNPDLLEESLQSTSIFLSPEPIADGDAVMSETAEINASEPTILSTAPPIDIFVNDPLRSTEQISIPEPTVQVGTLPIGSTIGHFRIAKYIGGGGMGRVYEGIDLALDRKVAIKILPRQRAQDQASVARFLNEAKSAARLNHEHIAQVYFCGEENGIPYIAFEYVQGVNLRNYVARHGVLSLSQSINFLLQISSALAHAAIHGVTHRDVKPSNILITPQGKAKLIDMGLARLLRPSDPDEELTVSGVTLGTFDYISPEQARDPRLADVRSDIYSLGCTFFFMMAGQPPFPEGTVLQKLLKHQGDQPPDIRKFAPETPAEVVAVMQKMMAKDPQSRYQTPDELMADLIHVAELIGLRPTGPGKMNWSVPSGEKRRVFLQHLPWISAILLLFVFAAAYYFTAHTGDKTNFFPVPAPRPLPLPSGLPASPTVVDGLPASLPEPNADRPRLAARRISPRDRVRGIGSEFNIADQTGNILSLIPRQSGGIGIAPFSSNDILNASELQKLDPSVIQAVELTTASETDAFSDSWSPLRRVSLPFRSANEETTLPEGTEPVVDGIGKKPGCYPTLEEAVSHVAARNRDNPDAVPDEIVIKLAFNGDLSVSPIPLIDCRVRITPANGFTPRLVFQPREMTGDLPPSAMFSLQRADLTFQNLSVFLDVAAQEMISSEWSVVRLDSLSKMTVSDSFLTIRNQAGDESAEPILCHPNVAFFRFAEMSSSDQTDLADVLHSSVPRLSTSAAHRPDATDAETLSTGERTLPRDALADRTPTVAGGAELVLQRTFLRGEAVLCSVSSVPNLRLEMTVGALAIDGPALSYEDESSQPPVHTVRMTAVMDRVIVWSRSPLFRIVRRSPAGDGHEMEAQVTRSLLNLSDSPLGEITASIPEGEKFPSPDWQLTDSLLTNIGPLLRGRSASFGNSETEIPLVLPGARQMETLSADWNVFRKTPFYLVTPAALESHLLRSLEENIESEKQRAALSMLENDFLVPFGGLFGDDAFPR